MKSTEIDLQFILDLLAATRRNQIEKILHGLENGIGAQWRPVGDRDSNFSTIYIASDPEAASVERVTNAIDATIERIAEIKPDLKTLDSPRKFVEHVFDVQKGYISDLSEEKIKELSDNLGISYILRDGDLPETPTVDVRDKGIGILAEEFPLTILSLNRSNKINKLYLAGRFGQGGSTALGFSDFTIILSRKKLANDLSDVAFTMVKYERAKSGEKDGKYVYLVGRDNLPLSVNLDESKFPEGTLVRHINYKFSKKHILLDVYAFLQMFLFDPILPFWLSDERTGSYFGERRRIFGSRYHLNKSDFVEWRDEIEARIGEGGLLGKIIIRYWVFKGGTEPKQKETFINTSEPIVITYLGQTHGLLPRRILHEDCKLSYLYKDLAIQIDCDNITDEGRRILFTSTRETLRKEGRTILIQALINALGIERNPDLRELNEKRRMEFLQKGVTKGKEEIRRRLAEMLNRIRPGTFKIPSSEEEGDERQKKKKKRKKKKRTRLEPLPTKDFPTFIRLSQKGVIKFKKETPRLLVIESDAPDNFLESTNGTIELDANTIKYVNVVSKSRDFKGGRLYLVCTLSDTCEIGTQFKYKVNLGANHKMHGHLELSDVRDAIVVPPTTSKGEKTTIEMDAPNVIPVTPEDQLWKDLGWTEEDVAEVKENSKSVDIYISLGNGWYVGAITKAKYTADYLEQFKWKYALYLAFNVYLQRLEFKKTSLEISERISESSWEKIMQQEKERAARTVLTTITSERVFGSSEEVV
jgi:hypothetical protein